MSFFRLLPRSWQRRIRNYAPRDSQTPLAFPTVPEELAVACARQFDAEAAIYSDGVEFTYLMSLRHREA